MSSQSNHTALFVASCVSLLTTSMIFTIGAAIGKPMEAAFNLTHEQMGLIWGPSLWGFTISIFICGFLNDLIGMKILHALSSVGFIVGVGIVLVAPHAEPGAAPLESIWDSTGTTMLFAGFLLMGLSQGVVEGVINPLIATIHSDKKAHKLNVLHAWWPGGLIIGGLVALFMTKAGLDWKLQLGSVMLPAVVYLGLVIMQKYPKTERVSSGVSTSEMVSQLFRPLFIVFFLCMWLTSAAELGPNKWLPSVMGALTSIEGISFLIYTAGLMFVLRSFAGPITRAVKPPVLLLVCAALTTIGLFWLGSLTPPVRGDDGLVITPGSDIWIAFAAATIFGVGTTFFWPTMLAITAEQFPKGGSLAMCIMGGAGMLASSLIVWLMGLRFDESGAGAAFQMVSILPAILVVAFGGLAFFFKAKGGYTVNSLSEESNED